MNYKEFVTKVSNDLKSRLSEKYASAKISAKTVEKLQSTSYYGIVVQPNDSSIGLCMNLKGYWQKVEEGLPYEEALEQIAMSVEEQFDHPVIDVDGILEYENMKNNLMIRVIPTIGNEDVLSNAPHMEKKDMAIVYYAVININSQDMASIMITNSLVKKYGISVKQLHEDAMANAVRFPAKFQSMKETMSEMMNVPQDKLPDNMGNMFVLTNERRMYGASALFYEGMMELIAEKMKGDYFVIPSSVHEVLIIKDDGSMDSEQLDAMVKEVNNTQVAPEDRLSDFSYHYDAKNKLFERAVDFEKNTSPFVKKFE